ncbi:MAG: hypothetical protein A3J74_05810 [Elusimicrobia bacterium RIFCSPHIGHO2_02_FULL_57_9]|nr:MAG: hypothetical protein A3J74_05810 [Elusimicrobia bacterium RIFCSPHIGHO2_02_FULL_57_9]
MKNKKRGLVLMQALVIALIVAALAAGITRMVMTTYRLNIRVAEGLEGRKLDEEAFALVTGVWNQAGQVCAGDPASLAALAAMNYACTGTGSCGCECGDIVTLAAAVKTANCAAGCKVCVCSEAQVQVKKKKLGNQLKKVGNCPCSCP